MGIVLAKSANFLESALELKDLNQFSSTFFEIESIFTRINPPIIFVARML